MPTSQTTPGNPINDPKVKGIHSHSEFDLSRPQLQTARFGELTPCLAMEVTPKDTIPLRSAIDVRSYTMNAPLLADVTLKKDYFSVPLQSILPINWEKVYKQPKHGDDVIAEDVNCGASSKAIADYLSSNLSLIYYALESLDEESTSAEIDAYLSLVFRSIVLMEYFLSSGALVRNMVYSFHKLYVSAIAPSNIHNGFDYDCEQAYSAFLSALNAFSSTSFKVRFYGDDDLSPNYRTVDLQLKYSISQYQLCFHDFLQMIRENPLFEFVGISTRLDADELFTNLSLIFVDAYVKEIGNSDSIFINFCPVSAYQIAAFHFYSNDNVDYIYSADLFRQLMMNYCSVFDGLSSFTYNGVPTLYDSLSAYYVRIALNSSTASDPLDDLGDDAIAAINYISTLFSFRRSLRYIDYFTGSKSAPLAVGDVNVAVNNNLVNIVDVSRNIQRQRFFNAVNRIPQKIKDYVKEIFNIEPAYDYHDPAWLGHISENIRVVENENTGEGQLELANSVTSVFRSNSERYAFEYTADRPGYVIGIMYMDIPRAYVEAMDKCWLHADRFDMFNPFLQFIGDQPITCAELGALDAGNTPFAYTLRHMEYKQTFGFAAGGFVDNLPGWSFSENLPTSTKILGHISPDFVRSRNGELDQFYVSLSGNTLASYFHFIIVTKNLVNASRPMSYSPQIL